MHFLDLTLTTLAANLALDEALLLVSEAGRGNEILRVWEWPQSAVILGSGGRLAEDVDEAACKHDQVPIERRSSGGGTVLLGPGSLCFSLVLDYKGAAALTEIRSSYAYILERLREGLSDLVPNMKRAGTSDLAAGGRKFSGNAQQRKRNYLLHHGTILYEFDLSLVSRYLRMPARQPDYRKQREHEEFLMNLPVAAAELKRRLREAWHADSESASWPEEMVKKLVAEKYSKEAWMRRR